VIDGEITLRLLRHLSASGAPATGGAAPPLSQRETDVVRAIAAGRTNQEIATELFISVSTVKGHVTAVQAKLQMRNRVEIAAWAWENRIVGTA
jgi:DNA-binding NarL/FixJ family response regulator